MNNQKKLLLEIINICLSIEQFASEAYENFSSDSRNDELQIFWQEMSEEEITHINFWKNIKEIADIKGLPPVFDDPHSTRDELIIIENKSKRLLENWESYKKLEDAFSLAYRMEFYMLHPAFETLFHTLKPLGGGLDPEEAYEAHINSFIEMLAKYGTLTPELELLGETIQHMWRENRKLVSQVNTDSLTKILNRRGFLLIAKQLFYIAQRDQEAIGVLMIDIDDFKSINDNYGHIKGDQVLKAVADIISNSTRKSDVIGRWGGEEFIILIPKSNHDVICDVAEKVRRYVETTEPFGIPVTISIGVSHEMISSDDESEFFSMVHQADQYLYMAKQKGKNQVVVES